MHCPNPPSRIKDLLPQLLGILLASSPQLSVHYGDCLSERYLLHPRSHLSLGILDPVMDGDRKALKDIPAPEFFMAGVRLWGDCIIAQVSPVLLSFPPSPRVRIPKVKVLVTQSCWTLCDTMDCSPPGPSVQGILQASR